MEVTLIPLPVCNVVREWGCDDVRVWTESAPLSSASSDSVRG